MPIAYDRSRQALFEPELRATVFGTGTAPGRVALAVEASRLAYCRTETGADTLHALGADLAHAGFGAPVSFSHAGSDSQGFGALRATDGLALLAFRGTQADRLPDLLTDLRFLKTGWPQVGGRVHGGFAAGASALWPEVERWLRDTVGVRRELLVCGHSLGAAIATLLAVPARATALVTIGSPRVGDEAFATAFHAAGVDATRIVGFEDIVARMPPAGFGYRHVGTALFIDGDGRVLTQAARTHVDREADAGDIAAAAGAMLPFVDLPRELSDHAPVNYLRAFWP